MRKSPGTSFDNSLDFIWLLFDELIKMKTGFEKIPVSTQMIKEYFIAKQ